MLLGRYEVIGPLGAGGVGMVVRARDPRGVEVAVKILRWTDEESRARFERERELLVELGEARGFVSILDWGESAQGPFLVMPLLEGGTLRERLVRGPLAVAETVELGRALATALGDAHARGIVHRDVKPENVLYTRRGADSRERPLLSDLGMARYFHGADASLGLSQTGDARGTLAYMSPEQLRDSKRAGPPADVFALGAVLYECLAGQPAFAAKSLVALYAAIEKGDVPRLRTLRPDTPAWLEATIHRALATDPAARFEDGAACARALDIPAEAPPRRGVVALLALSAVLVAGVGVVLVARTPAPVAPPPPASPPPVAPPTPAPPSTKERAGEHRKRGRGLFRAADYLGALEELDRALALDPTDEEARTARARIVFMREGERQFFDEVVGIARSPAKKPGDRARQLCRRAQIRLCDAFLDAEGARDDATQALELDPESFEAYHQRAMARAFLRDFQGGADDATAALRRNPDDQRSWFARSYAQLRLGRLDDAIDDATRAIEMSNGGSWAWATRGLARHAKGDASGALLDLRRAAAFTVVRPKDLEDEVKETLRRIAGR